MNEEKNFFKPIPENTGIANADLLKLIKEHNTLQKERNSEVKTKSESDNPIKEINEHIKKLHSAIIIELRAIRNQLVEELTCME